VASKNWKLGRFQIFTFNKIQKLSDVNCRATNHSYEITALWAMVV